MVSAAEVFQHLPSATGHRSVPLPIPSTPRPASCGRGGGRRPPSIELAEYSAAALAALNAFRWISVPAPSSPNRYATPAVVRKRYHSRWTATPPWDQCGRMSKATCPDWHRRLIPVDSSSTFFGFYNIFGKFAAIAGPLLVGVFTQVTGDSSIGVLSIAVLFVVGGILLSWVSAPNPAAKPTHERYGCLVVPHYLAVLIDPDP